MLHYFIHMYFQSTIKPVFLEIRAFTWNFLRHSKCCRKHQSRGFHPSRAAHNLHISVISSFQAYPRKGGVGHSATQSLFKHRLKTSAKKCHQRQKGHLLSFSDLLPPPPLPSVKNKRRMTRMAQTMAWDSEPEEAALNLSLSDRTASWK